MTTRKSKSSTVNSQTQQGRRILPQLQPQLDNILDEINDDEFNTNTIDDVELEHTNDDDDDDCDKDTNLQRKRKKTSILWCHFEELLKGIDGRKRAKCSYCKLEYIHDSRFGDRHNGKLDLESIT
ncbi:hypothetical protein Syun_007354 [Stephania yunnanensis]|uniref:BED-type domain-containing protein n=1 Tax=Stephania yunnanensis TaxID=152371 RepID=A0AAP0KZU4_9MAGN